MNMSSRRVHVSVLTLAILCIAIVIIFVPLLVAMIDFGNDYPAHIRWAMGLDITGQLEKPIPQFLYHVLLVVITRLMPSVELNVRYSLGAVILGLGYYISLGLMVFYWLLPAFMRLRPRFRWLMAVLVTVTLLLVGPITEFTWIAKNLYLGYLTPHTFHSPTIALVKPFTLPLFALALMGLNGIKVRPYIVVICAIISALSILAKPNYGLALVPALMLVSVYVIWKKRPVNWYLLSAVALPILTVLVWQYLYYGTGSESGFEFAPLKVMSFFSPDGLFQKFVLSITFPAAVYLLYFQEAHMRLDLNLAWVVFGVAAASAYLLAESKDWTNGNFIWGTQVALFVLFVVSAFFLFQQNIAPVATRASRFKLGICVLLLVLHLIGGIALYVVSLSPGWQAWL